MVKKYYLAVAYDISDDRRRTKVCKILQGFGTRVNYSIFECFLSLKNVKQMKEAIRKNINKNKDIVIYYDLCATCLDNVERIGVYNEKNEKTQVF